MDKLKVKIVSKFDLPLYATEGSVGLDIRAYLTDMKHERIKFENGVLQLSIFPGERALVQTGIKLSIPIGYECQVRPRSGLALKQGLTIINTPGTIDSDYRGDVGVIIINHSGQNQVIQHGDRIAQLVFNKVEIVDLERVDTLDITNRGAGGFGSTGKQ